MSRPLEEYAFLSNCQSSALVSKDGSIDWLTFPRFDSPPCFASLLGNSDNGHWIIRPSEKHESLSEYVEDTMVVNTQFSSDFGSCVLTDCMVWDCEHPTFVRRIRGLTGKVKLTMELIIRFDYGMIIPWVQKNEDHDGLTAIAGPDGLVLYSPVKLHGENFKTNLFFEISEGDELCFSLLWFSSFRNVPPAPSSPSEEIEKTIMKWKTWNENSCYKGFDEKTVKRSLMTLKALTYEPSGAILAAATTSLPEEIGGERNWDYRFSWIRDSSYALLALLRGGYKSEAIDWKKWLLRTLAGTPSQVNIMYGILGERRLNEIELPWLKGYEGSQPVRIGNDAYKQFQLDVFGELLATSFFGRKEGIHINDKSWNIEKKMIDFVCEHWQDPDEGIWEIRGPRKHFTHSKLMAWVALKYAVLNVETFNLEGDVKTWTKIKDEIHADICAHGFNKKLNSFVQYYGGDELDASLLMMAKTEFLDVQDSRIQGTIEAIQKKLTNDRFVYRYHPDSKVDGVNGGQGVFIACSYWLVDALRLSGKLKEAIDFYEYVTKIKNPVGLFSEEYSTSRKRLIGNFPQAFSHIGQIIAAMGIDESLKKQN